MIFLREAEIAGALRAMYAKNGFVFLSQVRNGTGFSRAPRTCDALALSTWPSRGLYAEGFEIKSSRADLARELARPAKSDEIAKYCKRWWLAVPEGLTDGATLPDAWGVISVSGKLKAKVIRPAGVLVTAPMDAGFVCALLRGFVDQYIHADEVEPRIKAARDEGEKHAAGRITSRQRELEDLVGQFEVHSGVALTEKGRLTWDVAGIGDAVAAIRALRGRPVAELKAAKESLGAAAAVVDAALELFGGAHVNK